MRNRITSMLLAIVMMATVFVVPVKSHATETKDLSNATITISQESYMFTKKEVKPYVTVKLNGVTLKNGTDYTVSYSNNIYPGTAKITVTGMGEYSGTKTKTFAIAKVYGLVWKSATTNSIKLDWTGRDNVTGYYVYKYDTNKDSWVHVKTVSSSEATITGLSPGYGYEFRVRAYYKTGGKTYEAPASRTIQVPTKPSKVSITSVTNHPSLYARPQWKKVNSSGYEVKISRNSDFSSSFTAKVTSSNTLSRKITGLSDNQKYYIKVRAYKNFGGKTVYGQWSDTETIKTDGTRWYVQDGKQYYYNKGKKAYGTWKTIDSNKYYFNYDDGALSGCSDVMWNKVKNASSETDYLIAVSTQQNRVCVYKGSKGNWRLIHYWRCSTGMPEDGKASKTPKGSWLIPETKTHLGYIGGHIKYTCWYATRFYKRCYFHSVLYQPASKTQIQDGRLGMNISDGCIRMNIDNAKWIYDNCHAGTRVIVY